MDKEFIPYEQALKLKVLGFNEPCLGHYQDRDETTMHGAVATSKNVYFFIGETNKGFIVRNSPISNCVLAPTFSQAFRWFREKHLLEGLCLPQDRSALSPLPIYFIAIISYRDEKWVELFNSSDDTDIKNFLHYFTYEEAELGCLKKLIEINKTK